MNYRPPGATGTLGKTKTLHTRVCTSTNIFVDTIKCAVTNSEPGKSTKLHVYMQGSSVRQQ